MAFLATPACSDGIDNDGDTAVDHPADPGCSSPVDWSEAFDCEDGLDNDGDGDIDHPADDGCTLGERPDRASRLLGRRRQRRRHAWSITRRIRAARARLSPVENPACSERRRQRRRHCDVDHPDDAQCTAPFDLSEMPDCSDGLDNDGDGAIDYPADPECDSPPTSPRSAQCSDGVDNDGDGRTDYPATVPGLPRRQRPDRGARSATTASTTTATARSTTRPTRAAQRGGRESENPFIASAPAPARGRSREPRGLLREHRRPARRR